MTKYVEVPLGVKPPWLVYPARLKELSEAITRYTEFVDRCTTLSIEQKIESYNHIISWAEELKLLSEMEIKLLNNKKQ